MTTNIFGTQNTWRHTATMPRIFSFDARILAVVLLVLLHVRIWTLVTLISVMLALWIADRFGYKPPNALRAVRSFVAGPKRPALPSNRYRKLVDYGFETHPFTAHRMRAREAALAATTRQRERAEKRQRFAAPAPESAPVPEPGPAPNPTPSSRDRRPVLDGLPQPAT